MLEHDDRRCERTEGLNQALWRGGAFENAARRRRHAAPGAGARRGARVAQLLTIASTPTASITGQKAA